VSVKLTPKQQEWLTLNNKTYPVLCKMCNNTVNWQAGKGQYATYCSSKCVANDPDKKAKTNQTNIERYGVGNPFQNKNIQEQIKQTNLDKYGGHPKQNTDVQSKYRNTCLEKYGVTTTSKVKEFQEKKYNTNLERYGSISPFGNDIVQEKIKQANLEKYGVEYSGQVESKKIKTQLTNLERYGSISPFGNDIVQEKIKQANLEKYGVERASQTQEIKDKIIQSRLKNNSTLNDSLSLLLDVNWLYHQYMILDKTAWQIAKENNISDVTVGNYLKHHEIAIKQSAWCSYKSMMWLTSQAQSDNVDIISEYKIPNTIYIADGYCIETNTIYEFHGDYWHGNPNVYEFDYINEVVGKSMGELYKKTKDREEELKQLGFNLIVMWESEFDSLYQN